MMPRMLSSMITVRRTFVRRRWRYQNGSARGPQHASGDAAQESAFHGAQAAASDCHERRFPAFGSPPEHVIGTSRGHLGVRFLFQ